MFGRKSLTCVLAASALWLSACDRVHEPKKSAPAAKSTPTETSAPAEKSLPPQTKAKPPAGVRQIIVHVPGMIDRQGIT